MNQNTYHPQLYTCVLEYAMVWSAPQVMDTISWPSNAVISLGNSWSSAFPWPNCPSSPRPQEQAMTPAVIHQHTLSIMIQWCNYLSGMELADATRLSGIWILIWWLKWWDPLPSHLWCNFIINNQLPFPVQTKSKHHKICTKGWLIKLSIQVGVDNMLLTIPKYNMQG